MVGKGLALSALLLIILPVIINTACEKILPPDMMIQPTSLNFGESETEKKIDVLNKGDERLDWYIDTSVYIPAWLGFIPQKGINETNVTITVSRDGLTHGTYKGSLIFRSNGGNATAEVIMIVF